MNVTDVGNEKEKMCWEKKWIGILISCKVVI